MKTIVINNLSTLSEPTAIRLVAAIEKGLDEQVKTFADKANIEIRLNVSENKNRTIYTIVDQEEI